MFAHLLASIFPIFALVGASAPPIPADIPAVDVVVVVQDVGEFRVRFDRTSAPNHVAHFLSLAASGQYDGNVFHRIIPGFLVQSGRDSSTSAKGDDPPPTTRLPEERSALAPIRGALAIAWRGCTPGTGNREWYICVADVPRLEQCGTFIGNVVAGMDVVDKIAQVSTTPEWNPLRPVIIQEMKLISSAEPIRAPVSKLVPAEDSTEGDESGEKESPRRK